MKMPSDEVMGKILNLCIKNNALLSTLLELKVQDSDALKKEINFIYQKHAEETFRELGVEIDPYKKLWNPIRP